eukprot:TRINITY_DN2814_c0_g2_i5.p1 TRINITY_DN2814_c0_g2~~TRINITY_DN2814_c0_g2_i5.p1  ORF type:complete len:1037 (+),score=240.45 TRINITY_DN2814_c0_g2_i5:86-3196(+)
MGRIDAAMEACFESVGRVVGAHPVKTLAGSFVFVLACCGGVPFLVNETRPEMQWVPAGSLALEHNEYVKATWPGNARFNFYVATCADVDPADCNILEPKYIKRLHQINTNVMNISVDGDKIVKDLDETHKTSASDSDEKRPWAKYAGQWSFMGDPKEDDSGSVTFENRACFSFGPFCGKQSVMDIFKDDDNVIDQLDSTKVERAINFWEDQEGLCPLSIATSNSPCFESTCQKYDTKVERQACRTQAGNYCKSRCPTRTYKYKGNDVTVPINMKTCEDRGCITMGAFDSITPADPVDTNGTGDAPESAFEFEPFKVKTVVGGLAPRGSVKYAGGKYFFGFYALNRNEYFLPADGTKDPVNDEWERYALCYMGIDADPRAEPKLNCKPDGLLKFTGLFGRSFGDEFGAAIRGDIAKLSSSYFVIIIYCAIMVGKRDVIHSGVGLSVAAVLIIGFTIGCTMGLMGYIGVPNSQLNNNLYFLILGLGVDDAFVLTSEFTRHTEQDPSASIPERIAKTARTGGMSVLITSATDALAFLVGASTLLPALSWFCTWSGTAIILCYLFQLVIFLPVLAINAARAEANRRDCFCCIKAEPRAISDPKGCCYCCKCGDNLLRRVLRAVTEKTTSKVGQITTILFFVVLAAVGITGTTMVYKDFKLEWFIPDGSYVNQFFDVNNELFASGPQVSVNMRETPDAFEAQTNLRNMFDYLNTSDYVNREVDVDSWFEEFMEWATNPTQDATASAVFVPSRSDPDATFKDKTAFYSALHTWYRSSAGGRYRGSIRWSDDHCNVNATADALPANCQPTTGLKASRMSCELTLASTDLGTNRYATMTSMRKEINDIYPGAFPWNFDFLYWEEVGIIDTELVKNLLICGAVIAVIVALLVPAPRISIWVMVCVFLSIVEVLGLMHFMGVTISGISTIYLLICVGLAVDYAAHIAHMFKESSGTARERAIAAVERIGPCTFNAVASTFLAVVVVGFSDSYIFRVFFKVLFLVTVIAGMHGLWLLPVILSLVGGDKDGSNSPRVKDSGEAEAENA